MMSSLSNTVKKTDTDETKKKVLLALEEIRPFLASDGGDVSLVSIENNIVKIRLHGACLECSVNQMTLKTGIETTVQKYAPHIEKVISVDPV